MNPNKFRQSLEAMYPRPGKYLALEEYRGRLEACRGKETWNGRFKKEFSKEYLSGRRWKEH